MVRLDVVLHARSFFRIKRQDAITVDVLHKVGMTSGSETRSGLVLTRWRFPGPSHHQVNALARAAVLSQACNATLHFPGDRSGSGRVSTQERQTTPLYPASQLSDSSPLSLTSLTSRRCAIPISCPRFHNTRSVECWMCAYGSEDVCLMTQNTG